MSLRDIEELGLNPSQVERAAAFFEAYGRMAQDELRSAEGARETVEWVIALDAASAYVRAFQWTLLFEVGPAVEHLRHAAQLYQRYGFGFGSFLEQAATGRVGGLDVRLEVPPDFAPLLHAADRRLKVVDAGAMLEPQQRAYLILGLVADPSLEEAAQGELYDIMETSSIGVSLAPIGALGVAVSDYWSYALALLKGDLEFIGRFLRSVSIEYASRQRSARVSDYLWTRAASPFEVVDVDLVCLGALAVRRLGRTALEGLDIFQTVPLLRLASDLGRSGPDKRAYE